MKVIQKVVEVSGEGLEGLMGKNRQVFFPTASPEWKK